MTPTFPFVQIYQSTVIITLTTKTPLVIISLGGSWLLEDINLHIKFFITASIYRVKILVQMLCVQMLYLSSM